MPTQIGENRAKQMLKSNELVLCMGVNQLRTPNIAMIAAACGFDAVYIDLEHNPTSLETAAGVCVAALAMGITPIARVTSHDPHDATRILDCGAQGVMVPHVQNAAEARAIVEACLYAPKGHRSAFGSGPQLGYAAIPLFPHYSGGGPNLANFRAGVCSRRPPILASCCAVRW